MPSPFPGMNPWIEQDDIWPDFHSAFIPALRHRIASQVLPKYMVLMEENVYVHEEPGRPVRSIRPDLAATRLDEGPARGGAALAELEAPTRLEIPAEEIVRLPFLKILDRQDRELIAVVELLSPANKRRGNNRGGYLQKRREILGSAANLVEIDLLRGHPPMPPTDRPPCAYSVLVSRAERRPGVGFWPIGLRDRLPIIPIPLRAPDADARVDLQEALNQVYDEAGYAYFLYHGLPEPPLSAEDEAWARGLLPAPPAT
ncbi:DUF4058 family protein [Paludisphaera soli]|uniref:DUF4058 family protein n=1 Tax=Paludisphaera soli TaxID=2712865 RepID=UPI0013EBEA3D|nr:DUF4058 family protein [Paludisphaera soli]